MEMNDKFIISIVVVLLLILGAVVGYALGNPDDIYNDSNRTILNVSSEGPIELPKIVEDIKTADYYRGYDPETLEWMESLGNKYVYSSGDEYVIMDKWDADKIPSAYVCDAYFCEIFSCNVLEKHNLGNVKYPRDVLLVKNVEFISEEVHYFDV